MPPARACPECGADMTKLDPKKHAISHWGPDFMKLTDEKHPEIAKRVRILLGTGGG